MKCPECLSENPPDSRFCLKCGTGFGDLAKSRASRSDTLLGIMRELEIGSIFARRYQVLEELGKGGMGKVYKVLDREINEKVALKLIKPEIAADEGIIERFRNELKITRQISHKNVCRMYHIGTEEGSHYITMEYVAGEDLKSTIRRMGQLSPGKAVYLTKQVCEGLVEAHRLGIIHRDLKPQNIMIDSQGNAKIMDFGIARSAIVKGMKDEGIIIGTPEYMSPEQVSGKEADERTDLYSLGVIMYEMVTGRAPFEGDTPFGVALMHQAVLPRDPRQLNSQIPESLSRVILKCLEKEKDKRYQNASELFAELSRIKDVLQATTDKIVPLRKPFISLRGITRTFVVKKLFVPVLIAVAVIILSFAINRIVNRKVPPPLSPGKPSLAVLYFKNNTGSKDLDHWKRALSNLLIADLSQSKFLRVLSEESLYGILHELNLDKAENFPSQVLQEIARKGRATHILAGNYARAGDSFRVNVVLQEALSGEIYASEKVEGQGEQSFFSMVDDLTRKIKSRFKLPLEEIMADIDREVDKITTSSPEAYRYYCEGRRYHLSGEFQKSIQYMENAVSLDPEFAMAYRSMAMSYHSLNYFSDEMEFLTKALQFADRISDRERYQVQGDFFYYFSEKTWDKAVEAYDKLLSVYPDDLIGNNNLGNLYADLEDWDRAIEMYNICLENKDEAVHAYWNLANAYMAKGLYDKAGEVLQSFLAEVSDNHRIRLGLAYNYLCQGKYDLALAEADKASFLDPADSWNFWIRGDIYHCQGALEKVETEAERKGSNQPFFPLV